MVNLIFNENFSSGIDPTKDNAWSCASEACNELMETNSTLLSMFPCDITREVDGKTELALRNADIEWEMSHSSFAVELDLNCAVGASKFLKTLLSSIYFAGALTGLIIGSVLYDHIGRKKTSLLAMFTAVLSTLLGTFCHNYYFLLAIRFLQGFGCRVVITGMFILMVELVPLGYRNYTNFWANVLWSMGYPIAAAVGYFVKDWNYMFLATAAILLVCNLQVLFCIESPRYCMIKNDKKAAKRSIKALAALTNVEFDIEKIDLVDLGRAQQRQQTLKQQLIDLCSYSSLLLETLIVMFIWFVIAMSYYGFNFGWGQIVPNRYLGFLLVTVGQLIGYSTTVPLIGRAGRRRAMMILLIGAVVSYLIAIPDVKIGSGGWTLESICCLVGVMFVAASFCGIYLWTAEITPTSHRGLVFSISSGVARVGSFVGPYIFNNIRPVTHKAVPLGGLAVLTLLCVLGCFALVETGDKETCLTGEDVAKRRKGHRYGI